MEEKKIIEEIRNYCNDVIKAQKSDIEYLEDMTNCPINGVRIFLDKFNEIKDKRIVLKICEAFSQNIIDLINKGGN